MRGGQRVPLSLKQTTEIVDEEPLDNIDGAVESVPPVAKEAPPLKEFMENSDITLDIPNVEVDLKTMERVASWQARPSPPPLPATHRLPFSSSLPPSSPLPPLPQYISFESSEFNPPSPQQEGNFFDADVSYESNVSDDFGFFAAQSRIHAKMDRERNLNGHKLGANSTNEADASLEESFSDRLAFATPYLRRQPTFPSSHDTKDATPLKQAQYEDSNDGTSSLMPNGRIGGGRDDDTDVSKRARVAQSRGKKGDLPRTKRLGNVSSKAPRTPKKTSRSRAGRSRTKEVTCVNVDNEGSDIDGTDSEEEVRIQYSER
jgi:hypothetical protein